MHNPTVTLMRTTAEENAELGRRFGAKLAAATGPDRPRRPAHGVSALDADGHGRSATRPPTPRCSTPRCDASTAARVTVVDEDAHINDQDLAVRAADLLHDLIATRAASAEG